MNASLAELVERNYASLRAIAAREIQTRRVCRSISPTSLVGETMVRLLRQRSIPETDPHLCGLATILMAKALADRGRRGRRLKRRSERPVLRIDDMVREDRRRKPADEERRQREFRVRLLGAMKALAAEHPREMEIVSLRLVLALPTLRVAAMVGISERTVYRKLDAGLQLIKHHLDRAAE
ncbi:MAG: ECF-type sigma factor [Phycisphaerales bacterium]